MQAANFGPWQAEGAQLSVNGQIIVARGSPIMAEAKITAPPEVEQQTTAWASEGKTILSEDGPKSSYGPLLTI